MTDYECLLDLDLPPAVKEALSAVELAQAKPHPEPTEAQREAGNYRKGHVRWKGFDVSVETAQGQYRRGVAADGTPWAVKLKDAYGYLRGTRSAADGDHVDVFLCDEHPDSEVVFVVNQRRADGSFDEHKCVLGTLTEEDARRVYLRNYSSGWAGCGPVTALTLPQFRWWLEHADTAKEIRDGFWAAKANRKKAASFGDDRVEEARAWLKGELTEAELDGIVVRAHPGLRWAVLDVLDWGDGKVGDRIEAKFKKLFRHVIRQNEGGLPRGDGWVKLAAAYHPRLWRRKRAADSGAEDDRPFTVAVDLDGTLAEVERPFDPASIGPPRPRARRWLKAFRDAGARVVVFTVRGDADLVRDWLDEHDMPYDHVNELPDQPEDASGKLLADVYYDDRAVDAADLDAGGEEVLRRIAAGGEDDRPADEPATLVEIVRVRIAPHALEELTDDRDD